MHLPASSNMSTGSVPSVVNTHRSSKIGPATAMPDGNENVSSLAVDQVKPEGDHAVFARKCFKPMQMYRQSARSGSARTNASTLSLVLNPDSMIQSHR